MALLDLPRLDVMVRHMELAEMVVGELVLVLLPTLSPHWSG